MTLRERLRSTPLRLGLTYMGVFGASVLALGATSSFTIQRSLELQMRHRIEAELAQLMGDYRDDGLDELRHDIEERIEGSPTNRLRYFVRNADGVTIFDRFSSAPATRGWHTVDAEDGSPAMLLVEPLDDGYVVGIAADLEPIRAVRSAMRQSFALALVLTLLLGSVGSLVVGRRFGSRLEQISRKAEQVGQGALAERMPISDRGDDFDQLALVINRMLGRIEGLVANLKRMSTNIAHDMRTPLGRIRQRLEALGENGGASREELEVLVAQLDESLEMFAAVMRIAEIENGSRHAAFGTVDLGELVERIVEIYEPEAEAHGVALRSSALPGLKIQGDAALLSQALVNLVENTLVHAGATTLNIEVQSTPEGPRMVVRDDGVGIDANEIGSVTEPFYRVDRSRATPGHGLGLSLVEAVCALHGARLELRRPARGLEVSITFAERRR